MRDPAVRGRADRHGSTPHMNDATQDPHAGQPVRRMGPSPADARLAVILLHGRGVPAEDILGLAHEFRTEDVAFLAPQAAGNSWYPYSFLAPMAQNEPGIS